MEANFQNLIHPMPWPLKQCVLIHRHYIKKKNIKSNGCIITEKKIIPYSLKCQVKIGENEQCA